MSAQKDFEMYLRKIKRARRYARFAGPTVPLAQGATSEADVRFHCSAIGLLGQEENTMANPRRSPYIHATWLAKLMAGDVRCSFQYWFQTHNQLTQKQPELFESAGWMISHTRMLEELCQTLEAQGSKPLKEFEFNLRGLPCEALIGGKIDCLAVNGTQATVYDCKTGHPYLHHQVQVMIYMYGLSQQPRFHHMQLQGVVLYRDSQCEIPCLPDTFASDIDYFVRLLAGAQVLPRAPGRDCRFCKLTRLDCPERVNAIEPPDPPA
jgi:PD-(D/E)XK nuclease superfamily